MDDKETKTVKCEACGFFSRHGRGSSAPTPRFYEVEKADRTNTNEIFSHYADGQRVDCEIVCFQDKINFMAEIKRLPGLGQQNDKLVEMVRQDRLCKAWYPYRPGFSPKEHYEELQMQRLEQDRRAFEKSLSDMGLAAQQQALAAQQQSAALAERNADIQAKNAEIAEASKRLVGELKEIAQKSAESSTRSERFSKRATWLVVMLAIAQIVVAFVALYHESYTDQFLKRIFGPLTR